MEPLSFSFPLFLSQVSSRCQDRLAILEKKGNTHTIAASLVKDQPRKEEDYLRLVVNFELNHALWQTVTEYKFSAKTVNSLAQQIGRTPLSGEKGRGA
jgi:hypothetical protein